MGAIIRSAGICLDDDETSSIAHAVKAGRQAVANAGIAMDDVGVLINVGVYRDNNMCEPAMAALIQKDLGMNPDYIKEGTGKACFSFDLMNGGIGALNALMVANSLLQSGQTSYVMIVGADAHPSQKPQAKYPYVTIGAAFVLQKGEDDARGLQTFEFADQLAPDYGRRGFLPTKHMGTNGRQTLEMITHPDYESRLLQLATRSSKAFLERQKLAADRTLLVSSEPNAGYAKSLGQSLGLSAPAIAQVYESYGDCHSSTFALGYHQLAQSGKLKNDSSLLFVGATSGLSVGCAHYVCA